MALAGIGHAAVYRADTERIAVIRRVVVAGVGNLGNTAIDHSDLRVAIAARIDIERSSNRRDRAHGQSWDHDVEIAALDGTLIGPDLASLRISGGSRKAGAHSNVRLAETDHLLAGCRRCGVFLREVRRVGGDAGGHDRTADGKNKKKDERSDARRYHTDCGEFALGPEI